jgi:class 3 adenylate cyclase/TolB-like protein/Tfp pilus assembly protein PilF
MERRLAAILVADVVGYSHLMGEDEIGTLEALKGHRTELLDPKVAEHHGRVVKLIGDGTLVEFPSVVEAVQCAVEIQQGMSARNAEVPEARRIEFRIGINLGDVIVEGDDIYGDGVNVAARLEGLADPGGICVSRTVRNQVRDKLEVGFEDLGEQEVKNIARPVRVFRAHLDEAGRGPRARPRRTRSKPGRPVVFAVAGVVLLAAAVGLAAWLQPWTSEIEPEPSVAVLPFVNQGGDSQDDYFSDGITEDIIAALGRFSNLMVFSRNAVFHYKDEPATPEQISRELGARYLVDGSVRKSGDRVRVRARLSDAEKGILLWSGRYEEGIDDIFTVQDEITQRVVGALVERLNLVEQERAFATPTSNLKAYDYMLQGRSYIHESTRSANFTARELFEKAIELDPKYASAYTWLARTHVHDALYGWTQWSDRSLQRGYELLQKATALEDSNALAHQLLAEVQLYRGRHDLAASEADRAIELNPNQPSSHAIRGAILLTEGLADEAISFFETAVRFDPQIDNGYFVDLGMAYFLEERYDEAIKLLEGLRVRNPDFAYSYIALAAIYVETGRAEDASNAAANVRRLAPFFESTEFVQQFLDAAQRARIIEALQGAGLN